MIKDPKTVMKNCLLEAYCYLKQIPYEKFRKEVVDPSDVIGFSMITVLDVFRSCEKDYQIKMIKEFAKALKE